jgi:hypothetical protein
MKRFELVLIAFGGVPMPQGFKAPGVEEAMWFSRGFIAGFIGRDEERYLGSTFELHVSPADGKLSEATLLARVLIDREGEDIGQRWSVVRRAASERDMSVGDPHDEDPGSRRSPTAPISRNVVKESSVARRRRKAQ